MTIAQHPSSNASAEHINLNIKKSLAIFAEETTEWDDFIDFYALIYSNRIHSTTPLKPFYLQFGYDQNLPTDLVSEPRGIEYVSYQDFVARKVRQLQYANEKVKKSLLESAEKMENYQHQKAKCRNSVPGQLVLLYNRDCDRFAQTTKRRTSTGASG